MTSRLILVPGLIMLAACTTAAEQPEIPGCRTMECVAIGESQQVFADFRVTPLEVLEDSRCPIEADCIWEGQVRLRAQLDLGHESIEAELNSSKPMRINGGFLSVAEVAPEASVQWSPIEANDYRFGFSFAPDVMENQIAG